jgi:hypothetical protein
MFPFLLNVCPCSGEDQQAVWRDIAAAMRAALLELEPRVPKNPDQLQEKPWLEEVKPKRAVPSASI